PSDCPGSPRLDQPNENSGALGPVDNQQTDCRDKNLLEFSDRGRSLHSKPHRSRPDPTGFFLVANTAVVNAATTGPVSAPGKKRNEPMEANPQPGHGSVDAAGRSPDF